MVQFQSLEETDGRVEVMDVAGKIVQIEQWGIQEGDNRFELNLSTLPEGSYLLALYNGKERTVQRFLIAR